jgi:hypothetical protein
VSGEPDLECARGTAAWVIAVIASTLVVGTRERKGPSEEDVTEASGLMLMASRDAGWDHVMSGEGVWALTWLEDEEVVELARELVRGWLDKHNLEIRPLKDGTSNGER